MKARLLTLLFIALPVHAVEVFVSVGEFGEVSYSDANSTGASVIEVTTRQPDPDALARAAADLQSTWALARAMEASRLAREAAAASRRKRREPEPQLVYAPPQPRFIVGYGRARTLHHRPQDRRHQKQRMGRRAQSHTPTLRKPLRWTDGR